MVKIKENLNYTITCSHCSNSIVIEKIEREVSGWRIESNSSPIRVNNIRDIKCPDCIKKEYDALYNGTFEQRCRTRYFDEKDHNFYTELVIELNIADHPKRNKFINLVMDPDESWHNKYCYAQELVELLS